MKTNYWFKCLILLVIACSCIFAANDDKSQDAKYWISTDYASCLAKRFPCECEKSINSFFYITLDTSKTGRLYGSGGVRYSGNELERWYLGKRDHAVYDVYEDLDNDSSLIGTVQIKRGKLYFTDASNREFAFTSFSGFSVLDDFQYHRQNVVVLNRAFAKRGYPALEKVFGDSLECFCNKELGVNMMSSGVSHENWIIEHNNDSVFFYRMLNKEKSVPIEIKKELVRRYKW